MSHPSQWYNLCAKLLAMVFLLLNSWCLLKDFDRYSMWDNGLFHTKAGLPSPVNIQTGRPVLIRYCYKTFFLLLIIINF